MCGISERNHKVQENGEWGENQAKDILRDTFGAAEHINSLVDFMLNNGIPIEVKTCQITIQTGQIKYPTRRGRFILVPDQHEYLQSNKGLYLFIVKDDRFVYGWKLLEANKINYKRHIQWDKIIERK